MRYYTVFFAILLISMTVYAQEKSSLELSFNVGLFNNSINEPLLSQSYGFLDNTEKANIIDALNSKNYIQFELDNKISYQNKKRWGLSFGNHAGLFAKYNESMVELSLLGNSPFKDVSLQLAPLEVTAFHYSKLEANYQWHPSFSSSLAIISGHQLAKLDVGNAIFSTGVSGSSVGYELDLEAHYTDTTDLINNAFRHNGIGATLGFSLIDSTDDGYYTISIKDLGFIRWNESTNNVYINSSWTFEGINVDDFIEFNDSLVTNDFDSIQAVFRSVNSESYTWRLPTIIELTTFQKTSIELADAVMLSVVHKSRIYTFPRFSFDVFKSLGRHDFRLGFHVGGFERAGFQFGYGFKAKNTTYTLFTKQANSIIPSQNYGIHFAFGIKRVFSNK